MFKYLSVGVLSLTGVYILHCMQQVNLPGIYTILMVHYVIRCIKIKVSNFQHAYSWPIELICEEQDKCCKRIRLKTGDNMKC